MNIKRDDSVRSLGVTSIGTDMPTKAKLKAAAEAAGLTLAEYLRVLANSTSEQGRLVKDVPAFDATLPGIASKINAVLAAMDRWENPPNKRSLYADLSTLSRVSGLDDLSLRICKQLGLNPDADVIGTFKAWYEKYRAKQSGQLELKKSES
jgi:hypothetical protein